jgi:hypothetical protein
VKKKLAQRLNNMRWALIHRTAPMAEVFSAPVCVSDEVRDIAQSDVLKINVQEPAAHQTLKTHTSHSCRNPMAA